MRVHVEGVCLPIHRTEDTGLTSLSRSLSVCVCVHVCVRQVADQVWCQLITSQYVGLRAIELTHRHPPNSVASARISSFLCMCVCVCVGMGRRVRWGTD
jgi:hypothetical protein